MNILLNTAGFKYQDGFYGSKTSASSFEIAASATLNVSVSDDVVCILLYIGTTVKTKWNGATVTLNGDATTTRTITGLVDKPSVQKIILDYRKKTPVCMPFNNYMKSYRLQDNSTTVSTSYRPLYTRYVYVTTDASNVMLALSQVVILHAETGENLALNSVLITSYYGVLTTNSYANNKYYVSEFPVSQYDYWIKFDLGDEYPVEQVILYTNATNTPVSYKVKAYTSSHIQIQNPTYSTLDSQVAYVRIQCSGTSAIVLQGPPSGISISSIKALTNKPQPTFTSYRSAGSTVAEYIEFTLTTPSMITAITVDSTISTGKPHQLIFYNQSRNEVFRTGLTYSPMTLSPTIPSILSYSFLPVVGTRQVRYVRYISNGDYPIQISEILVIDKNGINVALNSTVTASSVGSSTLASVANSGSTGPAAIPFTTVSSDSSEYVQVDLGQEYEILEVVYVNSGANQTSSTGCKILLQDSFQCQLGSFRIEGIATGVEIYDCRRSGNYATLSYSLTASNDRVFTEAVYGRYLRFENSVANSAGTTLSNLAIYDAYGKNISSGKKTLQPVAPVSYGGSTTQAIPNTTATSSNALNSTGYTTSGTPGDWWEIDLGQSYLIKDISVTFNTRVNSTTTALSTTIPYAIYGSYREELVRGFVSTSLTSPFTVPTNPTINTNTKSVRYVRISTASGTSTVAGTYSLTHIAVIDSRGMDIGVWKPVRQVDTKNTVTFSMLDGRYKSTISITNIWDLDLGSSYNVCSLICYGSGTGFYVTAYDSTGAIVSGPVALTATASSPQTITLSTGGSPLYKIL
jgi:hypothetical protein